MLTIITVALAAISGWIGYTNGFDKGAMEMAQRATSYCNLTDSQRKKLWEQLFNLLKKDAGPTE